MATGNRPETKIRLGLITATVWKNDNFFSVRLERSYKDTAGEWQTTDQLGHSDLLNAARVLERAEQYIADQ